MSTRLGTSKVRRLFVSTFLVAAAFLLQATTNAPAQERYKIINLPTPAGSNSAALGLNDNGNVIGYSFQGDTYQAFLYFQNDGSLVDLGSLGGKANAACAINDADQVTGYSQDANGNLLAFAYTKDGGIKALGALDGGQGGEAFGINDSGQIVGDSQNASDDHRPALFADGAVKDLAVGIAQNSNAFRTAYAINAAGEIVGRTDTDKGSIHAFLLFSGQLQDLGTLGGENSEALAINQSGEIVGDSQNANGVLHAFFYRKGSVRDLGTLPGYDTASYARGINTEGQVVGDSEKKDQKRAFIYRNGQMLELDKLAVNLSEAGFASLDAAYAINNHGYIVGYGTSTDGRTLAFLAVPEGQNPVAQAPAVQGRPLPPQPPAHKKSEGPSGDYNVFYSKLSTDGEWVEAGDYGYVFRPRVAQEDWAPYRDGHWVWTDRGWFWHSNEHFGWATYHYGRWVRIAGLGWSWVPGHEWAPAWVSWRKSNNYVGWAPLPPGAHVDQNSGISGWADSYYGLGPKAYTFISYKNWSDPTYQRAFVPPDRTVEIIRETQNITDVRVEKTVIHNFGPQVQVIEQFTNQKLTATKVVINVNNQANFGSTVNGNEIVVIAPAERLQPQQVIQPPPVKTKLAKVETEKGWENVKPADQSELKKKFVEQNPVPQNLATPAPTADTATGVNNASPAPLIRPATPAAPSPVAQNSPIQKRPETTNAKNFTPPNLIGGAPAGKGGGIQASPTAGQQPVNAGTPRPAAEQKGPNVAVSPTSTPTVQGQARPKVTPGIGGFTPPQKQSGQKTEGSGNPKEAGTPAVNQTPNGRPLAGGQETPKAVVSPNKAVTPQEPRPATTQASPKAGGGPNAMVTPNEQNLPTGHELPKPGGGVNGAVTPKEQPSPNTQEPHNPGGVVIGATTPKERSETSAQALHKPEGGANPATTPSQQRPPANQEIRKSEAAANPPTAQKEQQLPANQEMRKSEGAPNPPAAQKEQRPPANQEMRKSESAPNPPTAQKEQQPPANQEMRKSEGAPNPPATQKEQRPPANQEVRRKPEGGGNPAGGQSQAAPQREQTAQTNRETQNEQAKPKNNGAPNPPPQPPQQTQQHQEQRQQPQQQQQPRNNGGQTNQPSNQGENRGQQNQRPEAQGNREKEKASPTP
jgi:probable HAF family extracellular repeat protein